MAARTAALTGRLQSVDVNRISQLVLRAGLPVQPPSEMTFDVFMSHMMRDKKVLSGQLRLVLPTAIGQAEVVADTPLTVLQQVISQG